MMPQSTDRLLPEEMPAAEPDRAASGPGPVRVALAQQGLAWAVLPQAGPAQAGGRRGEPARVAAGQAVPFRAEPAQVASAQAVPLRAGAGGQLRVGLAQAAPAQVASGQVAPLRLAREEPLPEDPVLP
jgi:hypothetical protein